MFHLSCFGGLSPQWIAGFSHPCVIPTSPHGWTMCRVLTYRLICENCMTSNHSLPPVFILTLCLSVCLSLSLSFCLSVFLFLCPFSVSASLSHMYVCTYSEGPGEITSKYNFMTYYFELMLLKTHARETLFTSFSLSLKAGNKSVLWNVHYLGLRAEDCRHAGSYKSIHSGKLLWGLLRCQLVLWQPEPTPLSGYFWEMAWVWVTIDA